MKGEPFPDLVKLRRGLTLRGWTRETLAERSGLSLSAVYKALQGRSVAPETSERIARTLLDHPPDTATAAFLREDSA